MFKIAASASLRAFAVVLFAGAAHAATLPADLAQLDAVTPVVAETGAVETASYCTWVLTFEEGTTETPSWCTDDIENDG